ncbi:MAG: hypothetical protein E6G97_23595 [Alphaproteobacteria bacterium]|nr:MAG: hypothetical protein E6G97_23595 [Alphaproteobacteria bacterium]
MDPKISDFFPDAGEWKFQNLADGAVSRFKVAVAQQGGVTRVQLEDSARHERAFFFTGFEASANELRINRVELAHHNVQNVDPPLVVTLDPKQRGHVAQLFTAGPVGLDTGPYDGTVISNEVHEIATPAPPGIGHLWTITVEAKGRGRTTAARVDFMLQTGIGMIDFFGQFYGGFFKYLRFYGEQPPLAAAPAADAAPAAGAPPDPRRMPIDFLTHYAHLNRRGGAPPGPFQDAASRRALALWDLEAYERNLAFDDAYRALKGQQPRERTSHELQMLAKLKEIRDHK